MQRTACQEFGWFRTVHSGVAMDFSVAGDVFAKESIGDRPQNRCLRAYWDARVCGDSRGITGICIDRRRMSNQAKADAKQE